jgi:hypothetical protein
VLYYVKIIISFDIIRNLNKTSIISQIAQIGNGEKRIIQMNK